ncbi:hypothetical protein E6C27_scaffold1591G00370 [Cucumis melo var. makuwa]|uniref:DUF4216 domain-containing protein n=1 Tax=Cucumis melo var. makuwa TaxID=1194695 RepID=A0A5A7U3I9_CUCMM|nr:hypothetical protein E6C27_scaffold1591G00370 [Cucumis melo var. makuwa]
MIEIAHEEYSKDPNGFEKLLIDVEEPLYEGCKKYTKLSTLVKLYNLKVRYGWSDISFSELLKTLKEILPTTNELPNSLYEAKKTLGALGMEYEKIHACPNNCCLYRKEFANGTECPECGQSRWKNVKDRNEERKQIFSKVIWHFPPIPRFKRLFRSIECAENLTWHAGERIEDGPKQPGDDIGTYLAPLIEDLKLLWENGVECYNAYREEVFNLRSVLLWTINDFPAYGNLSGCCVKGYKACPICEDNTNSIRLRHGKKIAYLEHQRFLARNHPYRRQKKSFNGKKELGTIQESLSGEDVYLKLKDLEFSKGKKIHKNLSMNKSEKICLNSEKKIFIPPACYTLTKEEKGCVLKTLSRIKLFPIAIRSVLPKHVRYAITRLCVFFNFVCNKVLDAQQFDKLEEDIVVSTELEVGNSGVSDNLRWIAHGPHPFNSGGVRIDELGYTLVDLNRVGHKSESFILASQEKQVFYIEDPSDVRWLVVLTPPQRDFEDRYNDDELGDTILQCEGIPNDMPDVNLNNDLDENVSTSLGDKKVVKYNKDGAPIGENGAKLKSFIGSTTHYHVPITYTSWKSVPVKLKDKIFTTVEAAFVIDPRSRKNVLQTAGGNGKSSVLQEDIIDLCNMNEVKTFTLVAYMMYLYSSVIGSKENVQYVFVDPSLISSGNTQESRIRNLCSRLMVSKSNQVVLAPFNPGYYGTSAKLRQYELNYILQNKGVLLTTYDIVRNNSKSLQGNCFSEDDKTEDGTT